MVSAKTAENNEGNAYTITVYDVDDTRRKTSFVDKACEFQCSERRDLRWLADHQKIHLNENDLVSLKKPDLTFRTVILPVARAGPILNAAIP